MKASKLLINCYFDYSVVKAFRSIEMNEHLGVILNVKQEK